MFAAWPGMGNVALMAMDYLRRTVDARLFAELDMEPFYVPEEVVVNEGIASFPELPRSFFHEQHEPNLVFFESTIQTEGQDAVTIAQTVLEVAKKTQSTANLHCRCITFGYELQSGFGNLCSCQPEIFPQGT